MFVDYLPFGGMSTATPFQLCQAGETPPGADPGTLTREKFNYRERPLHDKHFVENTSCFLQFGSTITITEMGF